MLQAEGISVTSARFCHWLLCTLTVLKLRNEFKDWENCEITLQSCSWQVFCQDWNRKTDEETANFVHSQWPKPSCLLRHFNSNITKYFWEVLSLYCKKEVTAYILTLYVTFSSLHRLQFSDSIIGRWQALLGQIIHPGKTLQKVEEVIQLSNNAVSANWIRLASLILCAIILFCQGNKLAIIITED